MSHYVPDFEIDDGYGLPSSSSLTRSKKSAMIEEDIMELLWQNGQVVTQSQNQRSMLKKPQPTLPTSTSSPPSKYGQDAVISADHSQSTTREIQQQQQQHLFMQEDEMASWLHYPLNDTNFDDHDDFCGGLLYPPPSSTAAAAASTTTTSLVTGTHSRAGAQNLEARPVILPSVTAAAMRPPVPPPRRAEAVPNFPLFSRHRGRGGIAASEPGPSSNNISNNTNYTPNNFRSPMVVRECTVVDSSVTPAVCCSICRVSEAAAKSSTIGASSGDHGRGTISGADATTTNTTANRDTTPTCEVTVTSSPGGSSSSAEPPPPAPQHHPPVSGGVQDPVPEDRKRKGREDDDECHSEDAEFESANAKKQRGSSSMKRSRAAEVHNLSERRRRDRINEKMKALQELIPRCNKSDKASMLDEAIEYLKSLQLQVQMMSMGCGMVPMMFPGVQHYMSPMGMGLGLGMPMEMGMNRPILPFPNVLAGASLSTPATAAHLGPRFPIPAFHVPSVPCPDPSRIQGANLRDPMLNSLGPRNPNPLRVPTFVDPYQQYLGLHQMQIPIAQNQASTHPSSGKPSTSRGVDHQDNNQPEGT